MSSTANKGISFVYSCSPKAASLVLAALLCLLICSACSGAQNLRATTADLPLPQAATLEQNLLDLYGDGSALPGGAPATTGARRTKTVVNDIDAVPRFTRAFGEADIAIIIGVEEYKSLPPVEFATNDAELMRRYVEQLGFAPRNTRFLVNGDATESAIRVAVERWAVNVTTPESRVLFFYSGHGAPEPDKGDAYLVPYDGDPQYLGDTAYSLQRLYDNLGKLPAREVIVVIDACFSGSGPRSVLAKGVRSIALRKKEIRPAHIAIISATQDQQVATSFPEKEHGLFTYQFLKALYSGKKEINEIFAYVKLRVADEARRQNASQDPRLQLPESVTPDQFRLAL